MAARAGSTLAVGAMIETPRAALLAGDLAGMADFLSFGTNDLTQMTFGFSRDDVGRILDAYLAEGLLERRPLRHPRRRGGGRAGAAGGATTARAVATGHPARRVRRARWGPGLDRPFFLAAGLDSCLVLALPGARRPPGRGPGRLGVNPRPERPTPLVPSPRWGSSTRTWCGSARPPTSSPWSASTCSSSGWAGAGRACARSTARSRRRSQRQRRSKGSTTASGAGPRATSSPSSARSSTSTSSARSSCWPAKAGITLRYTDRDEGEGRKQRAKLIDAMAKAVDVVPRAAAVGARRGQGPGLPARAGPGRRRRCGPTRSDGRPRGGTSWPGPCGCPTRC